MCKCKNIIHNLYCAQHSCYKFESETQERQRKFDIHELHLNVQKVHTARICTIYDIRTIKIKYNRAISCKTCKLADIILPPYVDEITYLYMIHYLEEYFHDKEFKIVELRDQHVYVYHDNECINTMINNMITYLLCMN